MVKFTLIETKTILILGASVVDFLGCIEVQAYLEGEELLSSAF